MSMKVTKHEYQHLVKETMPSSRVLRNVLAAFVTGGLICALAQVFFMGLEGLGVDEETAYMLTTVIMIFLGALLTGLNIYDKIGKFGGAGASIPVTGFSNSIVSPAMEYKREGYVMGVGARMFVIAGPVLVYGIFASVVAGLIYYIWTQVM
ncbi:MAG TPA: stage V sporulation protein AC [Thermoclostridium sp.]|nr:stage V sporulation protein AC [Clostridiaceae bacterium]HOQ75049.1 stage V sporulation protein AC [Thermoclostridium sp.]HPU44762.1 stage V sporulation protein AC [Thermoclostridium sp.]